jgi:integrase
VRATKEPGLLGDGGGLYLQISKWGTKSWVLRYALGGKAHKMGLGGLSDVTLAEARDAAREARVLAKSGADPIQQRKKLVAASLEEAGSQRTFAQCAEAYIEMHRQSWKNAKHAGQWSSTLERYAFPTIGTVAVGDVETSHVLRVLEPIWKTKTETASRVRGRIETVLDWAAVRGYRSGNNPARWKGHLKSLLPERSRLQEVTHFPALPFNQLAKFIADLRGMEGVSPRGLEFSILTVSRPGMVTGATWDEVDLKNRLWTIPAARMKGRKGAGREHRVPLAGRVLEILQEMEVLSGDGQYLFPGQSKGRPLSDMAFMAVLRRMGRGDITAHGFRSTFSDWCAERTIIPPELRELVLAHAVGDKVDAAYRRGDMLEKRREVMETWSAFAAGDKLSKNQQSLIIGSV